MTSMRSDYTITVNDHQYRCSTLKDAQYLCYLIENSAGYEKLSSPSISVYEDGGFYDVDYDWLMAFGKTES